MRLIVGLGQDKNKVSLGYFLAPESKETSRTNRVVSKGNRSCLESTPTLQIWASRGIMIVIDHSTVEEKRESIECTMILMKGGVFS